MKKYFVAIIAFVAFAFCNVAGAKDVWVDRWQSENTDIYVMDETINGNNMRDGFTVSVKEVKNSRLLRIVKWDIYDGGGMWRYSTDDMSGDHDTVLMAPNQIFEFCMKRLGWTYQRNGMYYR